MIINQLIELLSAVQQTAGQARVDGVKKFQEIVWNDETIQDETLNDILSTIAYDLDFYEPDDEKRKEDTSYYGDERLNAEIKSGLKKLKEYK